jgi:hypothetical protein
MNMTKVKVSVDFSTHNYSDKELAIQGLTVGENLSNNPNFPTLNETATGIKSASEILNGYLANMASGNKQLTAEKNLARTNLENMLGSAALKVQDLSGGDEVKIISSGFEINRKRTPVGVLDQVVNVQIKPGNLSGSLEVSWDVVNHSYSYEIRYTKNPKSDDNVYTSVTSTKRKILLENLIPGQTYSVKVAAVGSDPKRVWSLEVISCYVS